MYIMYACLYTFGVIYRIHKAAIFTGLLDQSLEQASRQASKQADKQASKQAISK